MQLNLREISDDDLFERLQKYHDMINYYSNMGHPNTVHQLELMVENIEQEQERRRWVAEETERLKKKEREHKKAKKENKHTTSDDVIEIGKIEEEPDEDW